MGKNNKKRKRQHALFHAVKARVGDLGSQQVAPVMVDTASTLSSDPEEMVAVTNKKVDPKTLVEVDVDTSMNNGITDADLNTTLLTLKRLTEGAPEVFHSKRFKDLRRVLHPLVVEQLQSYDKGTDYRQKVTTTLLKKQWSDALAALQACRDFEQFPKQGTVQRWVRDCTDASGPVQMQLLQAILKLGNETAGGDSTNKHDAGQALAEHMAQNPDVKNNIQILEGWKWWTEEDGNVNDGDSQECNNNNIPQKQETNPIKLEGLKSRIVYQEEAAERTPPNRFDLLLHATEPGSVPWDQLKPPSQAVALHPVPFLTKPARLLSNVFSPDECRYLLNIMTTLGYRPDHPTHLDRPTGIDSCEWMIDKSISDVIYERVQQHLPATLTLPNKKQVALYKINPRWRCFRYGHDCVYRPHLDGSWPESYVDDEEKYCCPKQSDVKSYLTFLIYLNDDFEGGETRYYLPEGVARGVVPSQGSCMVFPQGNLASLIHEGALVTKGTKYVVRTDVLYRPLGEAEGSS